VHVAQRYPKPAVGEIGRRYCSSTGLDSKFLPGKLNQFIYSLLLNQYVISPQSIISDAEDASLLEQVQISFQLSCNQCLYSLIYR